MKVLSIAAAAAFLFLQSCSSDKKTETTETPTEQLPDLSATPVTGDAQSAPAEVPVNSDASAPTTQVSTASGMNPAHGEPGHRCDIAVGAPLNSPPGKTTDHPAITTQPMSGPSEITIPEGGAAVPPQVNMSAPASTPAPAAGKTPPGMNPPHGEPGHDCSIAVGAPLKK